MPVSGFEQPLAKDQVLAGLPREWQDDLLPVIRAALRRTNQKVFVLDDDPTGTQTVHDTIVLTEWSPAALQREMASPDPICYILTNSRSVNADRAAALNREIAANLVEASRVASRPFSVISRSDSTLRGHFPAETDALAEALDAQPDAILIIPAFMAGGRYTIRGIHYVDEGGQLIPAAQTPYAQDAVFAYSRSDLPGWVAEKTAGRIAESQVATITIDRIRAGGPDAVLESLRGLRAGVVCAIDAVSERDLEVIALACLRAEAQGARLIYRTAASFAGIRGGLALRPLLTSADLRSDSPRGGLIVIGSHVRKSSRQLAVLLESGLARGIELDVAQLLASDDQAAFCAPIIRQLAATLESGRNAALYTSRELISGRDSESSLRIAQRVSACLVAITRGLPQLPRFIIAKGGITSSDLATGALAIKRAQVLGQILPGIPVWQPDASSRFPGGRYVVFPGNVGDDDALMLAARILSD